MRGTAGLLLLTTLSGCSLLLDPEVCTSNEECGALAVCTDGVCVGPREETSGDVDEGTDAGPEAGTDAMSEPDVPMVEPDMQTHADIGGEHVDATPDVQPDAPRSAAPFCEIRHPRTAEELLTNADEIPYEFVASDDALASITFAGEEIEVDPENTTYSGALALDEGEHELVLEAEDVDGQTCTARVTVVVDRSAPEVELVDPLDTTIYTNRSPYVVEGSALDANFGAREMQVTVGGEVVDDPAVAWTGEDFTVSVPLSRGESEVCVSLTDGAGNSSEPLCLTLVFDDQPPVVRFTTPADGSETNDGNPLVEGVVEDGGEPLPNANVDLVTVTEGGEELDARPDPQTDAQGGFSSNRVRLDVGENTIRATVRDRANNVTVAEIRVSLLNPQPCVAFDDHAAAVATDTIALTGTFCPASESVSLQIGQNEPVVAVLDRETFTWAAEMPLPAAGPNRIVATATAGGVEATAESQVTRDDTDPTVVIQRPQPDDCFKDEVVQVCGRVTDFESGIAQVFVNGVEVEEVDPNNGAFCADARVDEGDAVGILVRAVNGAGRIADRRVEIRVDRQAPRIILDTEPNAWLGLDGTNRVRLTGLIDSGTCGLLRLTLNGNLVGVTPEGRWNVPLELPEADHFVELRATDIAGNERVINYGFRVDASDPVVEELIPRAEVVTAEALLSVGATVCDARSGITVTQVNGVDVVPMFDGECATFQRQLQIPEGITRVPIHVEDRVGNSVDAEVVVSRDVTGPTVVITWPEDGGEAPSSVSDLAVVEGTVDDGDLGSGVAFVRVNGFDADYDEETGTFRAVGVALGAGEQVISVVATDVAGNETDPAVERAVTVLDWYAEPQDRDGLAGATDVRWLGIADVDGDERLDIIAATGDVDGASGLFVQKGDRSFLLRTTDVSGLPDNAPWRYGAQGDFDADGVPDLILGGENRNGAFGGNGGDGYTETVGSNIPNGMAVTGLTHGDVNRDGRLDLLFFAGAGTRYMEGNGDGTFQRVPLADVGLGALASYTTGLLVDADDDGIQDVVAFGAEGSGLWIGDVQGGFAEVETQGFPGPDGHLVIALDADVDGTLDFFSAGVEDARFHLYNGDGGYSQSNLGLGWDPQVHVGAVVLDFDGDARDDLVLYGSDGLSFWHNGEGFERVFPSGLPVGVGAVSYAIAVDVELDGDLDLVYASADGLHILRSNLTTIDAGYRYVHLDVFRALQIEGGVVGALDAVGALLFQDTNADFEPDRVLVPAPVWTTVMTLAGADDANATCKYVDKGMLGGRLQDIVEVPESTREAVYARE